MALKDKVHGGKEVNTYLVFGNCDSRAVGTMQYSPLDPEASSIVRGTAMDKRLITEVECPEEAWRLARALQPILCWDVFAGFYDPFVAPSAVVTKEVKRILRLGTDAGEVITFFNGFPCNGMVRVDSFADAIEAESFRQQLADSFAERN